MSENLDLSSFPFGVLIGYVCFLLAALFVFVWPKAKAAPYRKRISWPGYILHYFHPLAWVLFAIASFLAAKQPVVAVIVAMLGITVYGVFLLILTKA